MTTEPVPQSDHPSGSPVSGRVLVLNHRGDPLDDAVSALATAGFDVETTASVRETQQLLATRNGDDRNLVAVVLNPVVLTPHGAEVELVRGLESGASPVPVILLVDGLPALEVARRMPVTFFDFIVRPAGTDELVHRVDLARRTGARLRVLEARNRDLRDQVTIDFKTELLSERHFKRVLDLEFRRAQRHNLPLSFLLLDVDNFKHVNDTTEYGFGDLVLKAVAEVLKGTIRATDYAGRFGGDEFAILLPHTTPAEAVHTAIRIRQRVSATTVESDAYRHRVTMSIGIDTFDGRSTTTAEELRRRANKALHEAKRRGKDQVRLYADQPEPGAHDAAN